MYNQNKVFMAFLLLLLSCGMLAGCVEKAESTVVKTEDQKKVTEEKLDENEMEMIPEAPKTVEGMIVQQPGELVEKHMDPEVEASRTVNFMTYMNYYDNTFKGIIQEELSTYFTENKELDSDEIYDYLVYQLGSGQYGSFYKQLESHEHGYVMPDLPEGKDEIEIAKNQTTNVVILMDASGSMKAEIDGQSRMELAKEAIEAFTAELDEDVNVSLLAYGHKGTGQQSDKALSCRSIDTVYPLGSYNEDLFKEAMDSFQASGWTPLGGAIEKAKDILAAYGKKEYRNIVYIVSDGIETCGGNPVAAAKELNVSNIEAKVNIIGFDVDDEGQNQLKQVAEAGGGQYTTVRNPNEFEGALIKKWKPDLMQVISQQGVKLQDLVGHLTELVAIHEPLTNLSDREAVRIKNAAYYLKNEELISAEDAQNVIDQAEKMKELRNNRFNEIKAQKTEEAKSAQEEIDSKVAAWKEKWVSELEK